MIFDSKFYNKLAALHSKDFDITTNNCGLFVGSVYKEIYNIDLLSSFSIQYSNEAEAFEYIKDTYGVLADDNPVAKYNHHRLYLNS